MRPPKNTQSTYPRTTTYYSAGASQPVPDYRDRLAPLLRRLRTYDVLRRELQQNGGRIGDVKLLTRMLSIPVEIKSPHAERTVSLTARKELRHALSAIGHGRLHLQVRRLDCGMPAYYLCRTRRDYWREYSLVVEDLYCSPGFPLGDGRFVQLMDFGHEKYHLRLSPFRDAACEIVGGRSQVTRRELDEFLYDVGRHVFQAAWHDDQRIGILAARHFDLPTFSRAIELLYLCLSGELCEIRGTVDEDMLLLFEDVYPQPSLHRFLEHLADMDGQTLNEIPRRALRLYTALAGDLSRFLQTEVRRTTLPLYKLLFSNMTRLEAIASELEDNKEVQTAAKTLEQSAQRTVTRIIDPEPEDATPTGIFSFFTKKPAS
jgi:hypothetical protein